MHVLAGRVAALVAFLLSPAVALAQDTRAGTDIVLPDIDIVAPAPAAPSSIAPGIDRAKLPGTVEVLSAQDIARAGSPAVVDALGQRLPGVSLSDTQGNDLTQDLRYRGFAVAGHAAGARSVPERHPAQRGVRRHGQLGPDPAERDPQHRAVQQQSGFRPERDRRRGQHGDEERLHLAGAGNHRAGGLLWPHRRHAAVRHKPRPLGRLPRHRRRTRRRLAPPVGLACRAPVCRYRLPRERTRAAPDAVRRGRFARRHRAHADPARHCRFAHDLHLAADVAEPDRFGGAERHDGGERCVDAARQRVCAGVPSAARGREHRRFRGVQCAVVVSRPAVSAGRCLRHAAGRQDHGVRNQFLILGPGNATFPFVPGTPYGTIDTTSTRTTTAGASLQATNTGRAFDHGNTAILGASVDRSAFDFSASSTLGYLFPDLSVGFGAPVPGMGAGPLRTLGNLGYAPVAIAGDIIYAGLYASDTFDLTDRLALSFGGRLNLAWTDTRDTTGAAPDLTASHSYVRFNPFAGATFKLNRAVSVYGGYAEANRVPTPLELSCSDPARPCLLANALVADPPLKQVVAHSYELGLRGSHAFAGKEHLSWRLGLFRTDSSDDILALASAIQGRGYYANVPGTRRQGVEAEAQYRTGRWQVYANYALVDATFRFAGTLPSPNSPSADASGSIQVRPGDRMPLVPLHQVKLGADCFVTPAWQIGADLVAYSSQYFAGDESNQNKPLAAWWSVNLHSSYQINERVQVFGDIHNLFNRRYATYGTYFEPASVAIAIPLALNDPRSVTLAQPLSVYGGVRVTW